MKKIRKQVFALIIACMMLTGCGASITGVSLTLPDTMEKGSTGIATPEYTYNGATPEQAKEAELIADLGVGYTSSNPGVIMVGEDGMLTAVGPGTAEVALSSEDGSIYDSGVITVVISPTGISMPDSVTLSLGDNECACVQAVVMPEDATVKTVEYSTADESVATVDTQGFVTAVSAGETNVMASIPGAGMAASCHVTVMPAIESLSLSENSLSMQVGDAETLLCEVTPSEAESAGITWSSSDEAVATVEEDGTVTAAAEGQASVTACVGNVTATCEIMVSSAALATTTENTAGNSSSEATAGPAYGAVPFSLAAGTQEWWHIDAADDAYWATLENINAYRAAVGVDPLSLDAGLTEIANTRTLDMVRAGVMSHDGYQTPEIIAQNWNSAQSVVDAWAASPGHYAAMTDPDYTICGIACSFEEGGATYWCVTFG